MPFVSNSRVRLLRPLRCIGPIVRQAQCKINDAAKRDNGGVDRARFQIAIAMLRSRVRPNELFDRSRSLPIRNFKSRDVFDSCGTEIHVPELARVERAFNEDIFLMIPGVIRSGRFVYCEPNVANRTTVFRIRSRTYYVALELKIDESDHANTFAVIVFRVV